MKDILISLAITILAVYGSAFLDGNCYTGWWVPPTIVISLLASSGGFLVTSALIIKYLIERFE
jgi:uncharacterized integral membrane protein